MIHRFLEALLYFLSGFVPRNRNKVLFGAWEGKRIADNPRYLALYLADCKPSMELVWIGDESCRSFIPKNLSVRFVQRGSLRSWLEMLTAGTCFVSHGMPDISAFNLMRGATRVYLGHGLAIKHMGSKGKQLHSRILSAGRHLLRHSYSFQLYAASSREHSRKLLDEQVTCNIDPRQIVNSGQPRVDFLLAHSDENSVADLRGRFLANHALPPARRVVTYLPTWRDKEAKAFSFAALDLSQQHRLQAVLVAEDAVLLEKNHVADLERGVGAQQVKQERVFSLGNSQDVDTQELLLITDLLITDYSGCYVDFLVLNRPIIHFAYDREYYEHADRGLYFNLDEVAGGPIVSDFQSLCVVMQQCLNDPGNGKDQRLRSRTRLAEFERGTACEQLAKFALSFKRSS